MMRARARWTTAYVALAAADTWLAGSRSPGAREWRHVTKAALMPALAASLVATPGSQGSPLRRTTLLAQACGWGGDVALLHEGDPAFFAGAGSFAVGHAAYITGFHRLRRPGVGSSAERAPWLVAAFWGASMPVVAAAAARKDPALGVAVAAYSALLATTLVTATRLSDELPAEVRRLAVAGAALFLASDTILGARMFLLHEPPPLVERLVMATYAGAQLLLSEAAARAR